MFFPEGAFGPTNNCVGIAQVLASRGVRVLFVVEESFAGTLEAKGFEERRMRLKPAPAVPEEPGQFWKDFIRETAPVFRRPTIEQLDGFVAPTFQALVDGAKYVDARLLEIIDELAPDAIVEVVCRDTAHFTELLTQRLHHVDGVLSAESFLVLEIHKMAYGWGVGEVATAEEPAP